MFTVAERRTGETRPVPHAYEESTGTTLNIFQTGRNGRGMLCEFMWRGATKVLFLVDHDRGDESPGRDLWPQTSWITHFDDVPRYGYWGARLTDYVQPVFATGEERDAAYMKAVEGLLVYGSLWNGIALSGRFIVHADSGTLAGEYTLADFGYAGALPS